MRTLVVYYSLTGKTELAAKTIAGELGADLRKVEDEKKHSMLWYYFCGSFQAWLGRRGAVKPVEFGLDGYDRVLVGTPVWAGNTVPAINTFLERADFKGRTAVPFATLGGGVGATIGKMSAHLTLKGAKVVGSFTIKTSKAGDEDIIFHAKESANLVKYW